MLQDFFDELFEILDYDIDEYNKLQEIKEYLIRAEIRYKIYELIKK